MVAQVMGTFQNAVIITGGSIISNAVMSDIGKNTVAGEMTVVIKFVGYSAKYGDQLLLFGKKR
jgi:hypothetical protein